MPKASGSGTQHHCPGAVIFSSSCRDEKFPFGGKYCKVHQDICFRHRQYKLIGEPCLKCKGEIAAQQRAAAAAEKAKKEKEAKEAQEKEESKKVRKKPRWKDQEKKQ
ncbi:hypothetical protein F4805DRAFT_457241 [Annulohypoxylon moriforme]|nr:hypothetical protein F4805DRAFT_457241 [Annulohypoxylon moriforme]